MSIAIIHLSNNIVSNYGKKLKFLHYFLTFIISLKLGYEMTIYTTLLEFIITIKPLYKSITLNVHVITKNMKHRT